MTVSPAARRTLPPLILAIGIAVTAFNMRTAIVGVGPLLDTIRHDLGMSTTIAGLLTTLPVVCFGVLAGLAPGLARRIGIDLMIWLTMVGLTAGILLRLGQPVWMLFLGTAVIGASIAFANVLVPAVVKRDFPTRTGTLTGVYTMCLTLGGAMAAALMVPLYENTDLGWRGALATLAIPSTLAVIALSPRLLTNRASRAAAILADPVRPRLWGDRLAWQVSLFMGLQSFVFFGIGSWMAVLLADAGLSDAQAGFMWSLCNVAGLPSSFLMPIFAQKVRDQRPLVLGLIAIWGTGVTGLLVAPATATIVWMILFGLGGGASLALALMFIVLRSPDAVTAASLSGMSQAVGYCLAAFAPFLFGALHDLTGNWHASVVMILFILVAMLLVGLRAGRNELVGAVREDRK